MSEKAIGHMQLAIGKNLHSCWRGVVLQPASAPSPFAAIRDAIPFAVTTPLTSVTHLRLAESVLIRVGEVYSEQASGVPRTAKSRGSALLNCSFREGTCIQ